MASKYFLDDVVRINKTGTKATGLVCGEGKVIDLVYENTGFVYDILTASGDKIKAPEHVLVCVPYGKRKYF